MIVPITNLKALEKLIKKAKESGFTENAEVFINCKDELAITSCDERGYSGWFLDFRTGEIHYSD